MFSLGSRLEIPQADIPSFTFGQSANMTNGRLEYLLLFGRTEMFLGVFSLTFKMHCALLHCNQVKCELHLYALKLKSTNETGGSGSGGKTLLSERKR